MATYTVRDENGEETFRASNDRAARSYAREWLARSEYGQITSTIWVDCYLTRGDDGDDLGRVTIAIDPTEPECSHSRHEWGEAVVRAHGGGVRSSSVCAHCQITRVCDSWAHRPDTGEQGLESITYDEAP